MKCIVITYCIILTSFFAIFNWTVVQATKDMPVIFSHEVCLPGDSADYAWLIGNIGANLNESECFEEKSNLRTYECMDTCMSNENCYGIVRKKADDSKKSTCWMVMFCDSSVSTINDVQYTTYFPELCHFPEEMYRFLPDLYITPFIFNPLEQCQQPKVNKTDIQTCDYLSWHIQEKTDLSISPYRTKTKFHAHFCMNECIAEANCKAVIVEDVAPFGWTCHFYNETQDKSSTTLNKFLYEKICCPMQPIDKANDKLILYAPYVYFCQRHIPYNRDCLVKFWMMRNNRKVKGNYTIYPLVSIQDCLSKCLNDTNCIASNIDLYESQCIIVSKIDELAMSHTKFTLYILTCCNETDTLESIKAAKQDLLNREQKKPTSSKFGLPTIIGFSLLLFFILCICVFLPLYIYYRKTSKLDKISLDGFSYN